MEKQLLLKFRKDYADEFDVEGFVVMSETQWEDHKSKAVKLFEDNSKNTDPYRRNRRDDLEVYFGTNESVFYPDMQEYLDSFTVMELTPEQFQVLKDLFGTHRDAYSYEHPEGKMNEVPAVDKIENGIVCLIKFDDV